MKKHTILLFPEGVAGGANNPPTADPNPPTPPTEGENAPEPGGIEPPPEPAQPSPSEGGEPVSDPLLNVMLKTMRPTADATPAPEPEVVEPAIAAPVSAPVAPAPAEPAKKPKRVRIASQADTSITTPAPASPIPVVIVPPPEPATSSDADYIKTLTSEQQDELIEAEYAEKVNPSRKGLKSNLVAYYKRFDAAIKPILQENPDADVSNSQELRKLVDEKPKLTVSESKKVQRLIGQEETEKRVKAEMAPQFEEIKRTQRRVETEPKIDAFVKDAFTKGVRKVLTEAYSDSPVAKALLAVDADPKAKSEYGLELDAHNEESEVASRQTKKFLMVVNGLLTPEQVNADKDIAAVSQFVETEGRAIANKKINGKTFLPRSQFMQMLGTNPSQQQTFDQKTWSTTNYCTFTTENIIDMIAYRAAQNANARVKQALERANNWGFQRQPKVNSPKTANPPITDTRAPKAKPSPSPGVSAPAKLEPEPSKGIDVNKTLYSHSIKK